VFDAIALTSCAVDKLGRTLSRMMVKVQQHHVSDKADHKPERRF